MLPPVDSNDGGQKPPLKELPTIKQGTEEIRAQFGLGAPAEQVGPYKLVSKIGEGGFGEVWVAERKDGLKQRVALKLVKLGMDSRSVVARFEQERQALAMMNHEGIAKVFDGGLSEQGRPYFVMEYVDGEPITDFCDRYRMGIRDRLVLFGQLCDAVHHAHVKGIVHRDLKPSNILAFRTGKDEGEQPRVKVIDFGVAKAMSRPLTELTIFTERGQMIGTPAYMSPEQAEPGAGGIDTRSDVYALGVVLYELLVGATPFDSAWLRTQAYGEMQRIIREEEPPTPSARLSTMSAGDRALAGRIEKARGVALWQLARDLQSELGWIPLMAMRKEAKLRYQSAWALREDVERYLRNEPIVAKPESRIYRLRKFYTRNQKATWAASLALTSILVLAAAAFLQGRKATRERMIGETNSYIANVQIAGVCLELGQVGQVRERLAECTERFRDNWEWSWLNASSDSSLRVLAAHPKEAISVPVTCVAFSPDRRRIVMGYVDNTARIRDAESGKVLAELKEHSGVVTSVAFNSDGRRIVTGSADGTARIWDPETGRSLRVFEGHSGPLATVAFSLDSRRIVTGSTDETARLWDAESGEELWMIKEHSGWVSYVTFSPDGRWIATGSGDTTARIWDAESGKAKAEFTGHSRAVFSIAFSPDGRRIVTGSDDGTARIWDVESGEGTAELKGHSQAIMSVAFSPDGRRIVTGSGDKTVRIWNVEARTLRAELRGHSGPVISVAFSPDGGQIFTASWDTTARIWDGEFESSRVELKGHSSRVNSVAFSPDGRRIVTGSWDKTARIWDADSGTSLAVLKGHSGRVNSVAFSPDGWRIVTGSTDKTARLWDAESGTSLAVLKGQSYPVNSVAYSPDGRWILMAPWEETARVWDAESGTPVAEFPRHSGVVISAAFSPDCRRVVTGSADGAALIWDVDSGASPTELLGHSGLVSSVAIGPGGRLIVTGSTDGTARIWDSKSGKAMELKGHSRSVTSVAFSPDGRRIVTGSEDNTARIWDVRSGRSLVELKGHSLGVFSVGFSSDGRRIVTGSDDGTARIWDATPYKERFPKIQQFRRLRDQMARDLPDALRQGRTLKVAVDQMIREAGGDLPRLSAIRRVEQVVRRQLLSTRLRADDVAKVSQWAIVRNRLAELIRIQPGEHWDWYQFLALEAHLGGTNYLQHSNEMLSRFESTEAPEVAERTAKAVLLRPPPDPDFAARALRLTTRAVEAVRDSKLLPYYQFVHALALFRSGLADACTIEVRKALQPAGQVPARDAQASAVLALALHKLGKGEEAQATLDAAIKLLPGDFLVSGVLPKEILGDWHDWLMARVLVLEAMAAIQPK